MTPLHLDICLHYYSRANQYRDGDFSAPAVRDALGYLCCEGLLMPDPPGHHSSVRPNKYARTERLAAFVSLLLKTPLPVRKWADPRSACDSLMPASSHWLVGTKVKTDFSGPRTEHVVTDLRSASGCQSGLMVTVHPPVPKSGGAGAWLDVGWFEVVREPDC